MEESQEALLLWESHRRRVLHAEALCFVDLLTSHFAVIVKQLEQHAAVRLHTLDVYTPAKGEAPQRATGDSWSVMYPLDVDDGAPSPHSPMGPT